DLEGRPGAPMTIRSQRALASTPRAAAWAQQHSPEIRTSRRVFRRQTAPATVRYAVDGIWQACIPNPDQLLRELLVGAIEDCRACCAPDLAHPVEPRGSAATRPTPAAADPGPTTPVGNSRTGSSLTSHRLGRL